MLLLFIDVITSILVLEILFARSSSGDPRIVGEEARSSPFYRLLQPIPAA